MGSTILIFVLLFWFVIPIIGCVMKAKEKGHSMAIAVFVGAALGLIGLVIYIVLPESKAMQKKCPKCAEMVKTEAEVCKHCGANFT